MSHAPAGLEGKTRQPRSYTHHWTPQLSPSRNSAISMSNKLSKAQKNAVRVGGTLGLHLGARPFHKAPVSFHRLCNRSEQPMGTAMCIKPRMTGIAPARRCFKSRIILWQIGPTREISAEQRSTVLGQWLRTVPPLIIYIDIYIYISIFICLYLYLYIYIVIYLFMFIYTHIFIFIYKCICIFYTYTYISICYYMLLLLTPTKPCNLQSQGSTARCCHHDGTIMRVLPASPA